MTILNKVSNKTLMPGITPIPDVPDAPIVGTATATGTTTATIAYTAAATGGAVTTFTATSTPGSITGTGSSPITVTGLTIDTAYTFKVKSTNATATGAESAASNSVTTSATTSGTSWTEYTLPATDGWWRPVLGGASSNLWGVAGSTNKNFAISSNKGATWTQYTHNLSASSLAYGNGKWVLCNYTGNTSCVEYSSNDGATWTTGTMPAANNWDSIIYADGIFFANSYGTNDAAKSTDGVTWTSVTMPTQTNARRTSVSYSPGLDTWVTTSRDSSCFDSSNDGTTWTARTASPSTGEWYDSYGNSTTFVAIKYNTTTYATSSTGTSWTGQTFAATIGSVMGGEYKFGTFVIVLINPTSTIYTSTNGTTWTSRTMPSSQSYAMSKTINASNNVIMAAASGGNKVSVSLS